MFILENPVWVDICSLVSLLMEHSPKNCIVFNSSKEGTKFLDCAKQISPEEYEKIKQLTSKFTSLPAPTKTLGPYTRASSSAIFTVATSRQMASGLKASSSAIFTSSTNRQINILTQYSSSWQPDSSVTSCNNCNEAFSLTFRRHHCRICGFIFCDKCSPVTLIRTGGATPQTVRVCVSCRKSVSRYT